MIYAIIDCSVVNEAEAYVFLVLSEEALQKHSELHVDYISKKKKKKERKKQGAIDTKGPFHAKSAQ